MVPVWCSELQPISTHSLTKRLTASPAKDGATWIISTHSLTKRLTQQHPWRSSEPVHFNSQPHEEADKSCVSGIPDRHNFNSQPHEEADAGGVTLYTGYAHFNSQPHEEADVQTHTYSQDRSISTHSLTKRLTGYTQENGHDSSHFNSQPHEEADDTLFFTLFIVFFISTHSLTKRLTMCGQFIQPHFYISTHSLTKRLTWYSVYHVNPISYFNSQPHEEADTIRSR